MTHSFTSFPKVAMNGLNPYQAQAAVSNSGQNGKNINYTAKQSTANDSSPIAQKAIPQEMEMEKAKGAQSEVSEYLTRVSRLENRIKSGSISEDEIDRVLGSLDKKVMGLSGKARQRINKIREFQDLKLEQAKDFRRSLKNMLNDDKTRDQVFGLFKNQEFISVMKNEPAKSMTYSAA
ncbi:MAG: hypothetical protein ACI86H_001283 [bacterium]|jgi:hypothetical protein